MSTSTAMRLTATQAQEATPVRELHGHTLRANIARVTASQRAAGGASAELGEYVLDWDDARFEPDPHLAAVDLDLSAIRHACAVCSWDPELAASVESTRPPIV